MRNLMISTLAAAALTLSACKPAQLRETLGPAPRGGASSATPVVLCPLVDTRPAGMRRAHKPMMTSGFGLVLTVLFLGYTKTEGATMYGDANTQLGGSSPREGADAWLMELITGTTGRVPERNCPGVGAGDVDRAAQGQAGDALVIVPLLDQLDVVALSGEAGWIGGSSSTSGNTTTTTSGSSVTYGGTGEYANVRIRLVVLEVRGGQVRRRMVVYGAGNGRSLPGAFEVAGQRLAAGLAEVMVSAGPDMGR